MFFSPLIPQTTGRERIDFWKLETCGLVRMLMKKPYQFIAEKCIAPPFSSQSLTSISYIVLSLKRCLNKLQGFTTQGHGFRQIKLSLWQQEIKLRHHDNNHAAILLYIQATTFNSVPRHPAELPHAGSNPACCRADIPPKESSLPQAEVSVAGANSKDACVESQQGSAAKRRGGHGALPNHAKGDANI